MRDFNKDLIGAVKKFQDELSIEKEYVNSTSAFMLYLCEQLEDIDSNEVAECQESFSGLGTNLDGYYFDEDCNVHHLFISIFDEFADDNSRIADIDFEKKVKEIHNFIEFSLSAEKKYKYYEHSSLSYEISDNLNKRESESEIVVSIYCNLIVSENKKRNDIEEISETNVSFTTFDLLDLKEKFLQLSNDNSKLDLVDKFGSSVEAIRISSTIDFDVYMCSFKGKWLAQLYKEDGQRLLESNVRSYLKRTQKTNAGILETVKSYPEQFVSYNNGLSSVAVNIEKDQSRENSNFCFIKVLYNFQIVNGGQTTATLAECLKDKLNDELDDVIVPVKLTVIKNVVNSSNLISNISVFSNTQTAIKKSDPPSNLPYYRKIKNFSMNTVLFDSEGNDYICYFERTSGEYETDLRRNNNSGRFKKYNPKSKKFTKIDLAKGVNCWEQLPFIVNLGREKNFAYFNEIIKNQLEEPNENYFKKVYATIILFKYIDKKCKNLKLNYKSNVSTYALSYLSFLSNKQIDLLKIFNEQKIDDNIDYIIMQILPKIHEQIINPYGDAEIRMWARKEDCWERIKALNLNFTFNDLGEITDFFPVNEPKLFIENSQNIYNDKLWLRLLNWNEKKKTLNKSQINMIKGLRYYIYEGKILSKKQLNYVKDIFMACVKAGFQYKE